MNGLKERIESAYKIDNRNREGREFVFIRYTDGTKRSVSYPKFLVEYLLDRELDPNKETIDHLDGNFYNNSWDNMRIVDRKIHAAQDMYREIPVEITCVLCKKKVLKSPHNLIHNAKQKKAGPFCGKSCAGKYGKMVQNGYIEPLPAQTDQYERTYYEVEKTGGITVSTLEESKYITEQDILDYLKRMDSRRNR